MDDCVAEWLNGVSSCCYFAALAAWMLASLCGLMRYRPVGGCVAPLLCCCVALALSGSRAYRLVGGCVAPLLCRCVAIALSGSGRIAYMMIAFPALPA